jgi:Mn2+/Fe2+ NRAMP family transporter
LNVSQLQAADFARALEPLAGPVASLVFALGILNAGLFTATVLPLSTSFVICEALGFEAAVDRKFREAPVFFSLFGAGLLIGAGIVLIPGIPYTSFILWAQTLQGMALPPELVLMILIINRRSVMGSYTNTRLGNAIAWITTIVVGTLSIVAAAQQILPRLHF